MDDITGLLGTGDFRIPETIDGGRYDLAQEFLRDPLGKHSIELQLLLGRMRSDTRLGRFVLTHDHVSGAYRLWSVPAVRGEPLLSVAECDSREHAERLAFVLRWRLHTGRRLATDSSLSGES